MVVLKSCVFGNSQILHAPSDHTSKIYIKILMLPAHSFESFFKNQTGLNLFEFQSIDLEAIYMYAYRHQRCFNGDTQYVSQIHGHSEDFRKYM